MLVLYIFTKECSTLLHTFEAMKPLQASALHSAVQTKALQCSAKVGAVSAAVLLRFRAAGDRANDSLAVLFSV